MTVTAASFKADARFSEFSAVADAVVTSWLTTCAQDMNPDRWGSKYDEGLAFLTAHTMVMMGVVTSSSSESPSIKSKTVGPVKLEYDVGVSAGAGNDSDYESTTYGQMYLRKRRTLVRSPLVL